MHFKNPKLDHPKQPYSRADHVHEFILKFTHQCDYSMHTITFGVLFFFSFEFSIKNASITDPQTLHPQWWTRPCPFPSTPMIFRFKVGTT